MPTPFFEMDSRLNDLAEQVRVEMAPVFSRVEEIADYNQQKVLSAFIRHRVSEAHFVPTTGYGYGDRGREVLEEVFADVLGAEDALVRHSILCGTHAITVALFGVLRPGDVLLAATGAPYDTLLGVIGADKPSDGSLAEYGVEYREVPLNREGLPNLEGICEALRADPAIKVVHIQRSRGYNLRPSLTVARIGEIVEAVRSVRSDVIVFVDNCYGEFAEREEPTAVGVDLMAGSLIKNPGGGIAENGGYICGRRDLVEKCAYRLTTPGLGKEVGASLGHNRTMFMGLFQAPHVVGEAMKTAVFAAALFEKLGYRCTPTAIEERADIIQAIQMCEAKPLIAFCQGIQSGAPVDAFVTPEPWDMPGYDNQVIMAAGAFTMGSSIELSADAPLREPFAVYMQGGLNFSSGRIGVLLAAQKMLDAGVLSNL